MAESDKVLFMVKITTDKVRDFNIFWAKESLPYWIEHGGKHIGSYVYKVNGPSNVIVRLFEYESFDKWQEWEKWLFGDSQDAQNLRAQISKWGVLTETSVLVPAPTA